MPGRRLFHGTGNVRALVEHIHAGLFSQEPAEQKISVMHVPLFKDPLSVITVGRGMDREESNQAGSTVLWSCAELLPICRNQREKNGSLHKRYPKTECRDMISGWFNDPVTTARLLIILSFDC